MTHQTPPEHFKGRSVSEHLKEARLRGARATSEVHGTELPGHLSAATDSAKNTSILFLLLFAAGAPFSLFLVFAVGWLIWSSGRSALLGWARLERLHRVIEEERYEIEHHREQEKEELREMYADKGFSGPLLEQVVEVLMSDDNRLLKIMLEEELGLSLEAYEHPLKQATGAAVGCLISSVIALLSFYFWEGVGIPLTSLLIVIIAASQTAKYEKRKRLPSAIWNFSLALFAAGIVYFLTQL